MIFGFNVGSIWAYHLYIITIMTWVWDGYVHGLYMGPRWVFRKNNSSRAINALEIIQTTEKINVKAKYIMYYIKGRRMIYGSNLVSLWASHI